MDISVLKEFLLLSKMLNYRVAAESLFITQSTLSKHIKALEKELNVELFNRSTVNVALSESGYVFLEFAKRIVREYDMAQEALAGVQHVHGMLRVGGAIRYPVINKIIAATFAVFETKYPDVAIVAEDIQWQDFKRPMMNGKHDIVFSARFPNLDSEGMVYRDICTVPLCVWVKKDNPLAERESVTLEELSKLTLRILDPFKSETFASYMRGLFEQHDISIKVGKPMSLLYTIEDDEFAPTPAFSPGEFFGPGLSAVPVSGVDPIPISCYKPRHISNPITSLFFDEFMAASQEWSDDFKEKLIQTA